MEHNLITFCDTSLGHQQNTGVTRTRQVSAKAGLHSKVVDAPAPTQTASRPPLSLAQRAARRERKLRALVLNSDGARHGQPYRAPAEVGSPLLRVPMPPALARRISVVAPDRTLSMDAVRVISVPALMSNTTTGTAVLVSTRFFRDPRNDAAVDALAPVPFLGDKGLRHALRPDRVLATHEGAAAVAQGTGHRKSHPRMVAHLLRPHDVGLEDLCGGFLALNIVPAANRDSMPVYPFGKAAARCGGPTDIASVFIGQLPRSYTAVDVALVLFALTGIMPVMVKLVPSRDDAVVKMGGAIADFKSCDDRAATALSAAIHVAKHNHCAVLGDVGAFIGTPLDAVAMKRWVDLRDAALHDEHGLQKKDGDFGVGAMTIELSTRTLNMMT